MTVMQRLATAVGMCAAAISAWAYPTLYGDTGLVLTPTADTLPVSNFQIAADLANVDMGGSQAKVLPVRLLLGASDNSEFSILYVAPQERGTGFEALLGATGKVALLKEDIDEGLPGIAAGGRVVRDADDLSCGFFEGYLVMSKSLFAHRANQDRDGFKFRVHGGVSYLNFAEGQGASSEFVAPFVGASFSGEGGSEACIDYLGDLKEHGRICRKATLSGAVRVAITDSLSLEAGATRPFNMGGETTTFFGAIVRFDPDRSSDCD